MKKGITRNEFLKKGVVASTGVGAVTLLGVQALSTGKAAASPSTFSWPWPYSTLDPEAVRILGHDSYWNGMACSAGAFHAIIACLQNELGDPYTNFPTKMMIFGHGGGAGWGTICGALNGAAAAIALVTEKAVSDVLINELIGWYTQEKFPSDISNTYAVEHTFGHTTHDMVLQQGVCESPLCHVSVTHWCGLTSKAVGSNERKERCARLAGDVAAKAVELLNASFAGTFVSDYTPAESIAACMTCHGSSGMVNNVAMKQTCVPCHGPNPHTQGSDLKMLGHDFKIKQNFPNPFNADTAIEFTINQGNDVTIEVFNLNGQHIKTLVSNEFHQPGDYSLRWQGMDENGASVKPGMYVFRIRVGKAVKTLNMIKM